MNTGEPFRVALIGDVHLRRVQYGNPARRQQITNSLLSIIEKAHQHGCKAILCAGDFLDSNAPGIDVVALDIPKIDELLRKYKLPMYVTKGNHDNVETPWYGILHQYTMNKIMESDEYMYGIHPLDDACTVIVPGTNLVVKGYDYGYPSRMKELAADPSSFNESIITMMHGELLDISSYPTDNAVEVDDFNIETTSTQLVLIGHTHIRTCIVKDCEDAESTDLRLFVSPGSVDYISSSEVKNDEGKKFYIAEFQNGILRSVDAYEYEHTFAKKVTLNTEEDIADIIKSIDYLGMSHVKKRGLILYVSYDAKLKNSIAELKRRVVEMDPEFASAVTIVPKAILTDTQELDLSTARSIKEGPVEFFAKNSNRFFTEAKEADFLNLCSIILDPKSDAKAALDTYVETKTSLTIV